MNTTKLTTVEQRRNGLLKTSYPYNTLTETMYELACIFHTEEDANACAKEVEETVVDSLYGNEYIESIQFRCYDAGDFQALHLDAVIAVMNGAVKYTRKAGGDFVKGSDTFTKEEAGAIARVLLGTFNCRPCVSKDRKTTDVYTMGNALESETVNAEAVIDALTESIHTRQKITCGRGRLTIPMDHVGQIPLIVSVK